MTVNDLSRGRFNFSVDVNFFFCQQEKGHSYQNMTPLKELLVCRQKLDLVEQDFKTGGIPISIEPVEGRLHYMIYSIHLFDHGVQLTFFCGRSGLPSYLRIDDYFVGYKKSPHLPSRKDIFRIIDTLATSLGCVLTYVEHDSHRYISRDGTRTVLSRDIDTLAGNVTFYQRAWPQSVVASQSQIVNVLRGGADPKLTRQGIQKRVKTFREKFQQQCPPQIRQTAIQCLKNVKQNPSQKHLIQCATFLQDVSRDDKQYVKQWMKMIRGDEFETVVKFY